MEKIKVVADFDWLENEETIGAAIFSWGSI